jgi:Kef-type K+ transport system membrane component KefB
MITRPFSDMSHLLQLLLILAIILAVAKWAGSLSMRWGQPAVFGKILVGLILGPTVLNILGWPIFLPVETTVDGTLALPVFATVKDIAEIGVILLMFLAGLETELGRMMKVGKAAFLAATGGVVLPLILGSAAAFIFIEMGLKFTVYEAIFIGTILTATSVSISAQTLMELNALKSKEGMTILGAAVIDDVMGIVLLSIVIAFRPTGAGVSGAPTHALDWVMSWLSAIPALAPYEGILRVFVLIILMALFVAMANYGFRYAKRYIAHMGAQPVTAGLVAAAVVTGFMYAWMAEFIGNLAAITGAYIAGVLIGQTQMKEQVEHELRTLTYGIFVSVFFISIGLEANARTVFSPLAHLRTMTTQEWLLITFALLIIVIAVYTKAWGCMFGAMAAGFTRTESWRVGVGMISRGEVGLIVASVGLSSGIIGIEVFSMMILMVLVSTLVTPVWLKRVIPHGLPEA